MAEQFLDNALMETPEAVFHRRERVKNLASLRLRVNAGFLIRQPNNSAGPVRVENLELIGFGIQV